jgi:N-dimethylarginine dimethylaminohydrolase
LGLPYFTLCPPFYVSNDRPNNPWIEGENTKPFNREKAYAQWMDLYKVLSSMALVDLLPAIDGAQDQNYVANIGLELPEFIARKTFILSNFRSEPRKIEEGPARAYFALKEFNVVQPSSYFEGFADIKFIRPEDKGGLFIGGYGIRTAPETYDWMMQQYSRMRIIPVKMTNERLYHFDTEFFPVDKENALVAIFAIEKEDLKEIEKVVNVIDVAEPFAMAGTTNCIRCGNKIINQSNIAELEHGTEEYTAEKERVDWLTETVGRLGFDPVFVNLSEFEKSGASASCFALSNTFKDYL